MEAGTVDRHLVTIAARLELEPVLARLRALHLLSRDACERVANKQLHPTSADRAEALVNLLSSERRWEAFLDALRQTSQGDLADAIVQEAKDAEAKLSKTLPDDLVSEGTSKREPLLRDLSWTCGGPDGSVCGERCAWERFNWCRKCRRFLCYQCIYRAEHNHKPRHFAQFWVKGVLQTVDAQLEGEEEAELKKLEAEVSEFGRRLVELMLERLRTEHEASSVCSALRHHLKTHLGKEQKATVKKLEREEAWEAAVQAIAATAPEADLPLPSYPRPAFLQTDPVRAMELLWNREDQTKHREAPSTERGPEPAFVHPDSAPVGPVIIYSSAAKSQGLSESFAEGLTLADETSASAESSEASDATAATPASAKSLPDHPSPEDDRAVGSATPAKDSPEELLFAALLRGDSAAAEESLAAGADLGKTDPAGRRALLLAARGGAAGFLAAHIGQPGLEELDFREPATGWTPLMAATAAGHKGCVMQLLSAGADRTIRNEAGVSVLHLAASEGHAELLSLLLVSFPALELDAVDEDGGSALLRATEAGSLACLRLMLKAEADPGLADGAGRTPLQIAAARGSTEIVAALLGTGRCDLNVAAADGETALTGACRGGHAETAVALLEAGASVVRWGPRHDLPIHIAAQRGGPTIVRRLIAAASPINEAGQNGTTPLMRACEGGCLASVQALLRAGADPTLLTPQMDCAMGQASQYGFHEILGHLLEHCGQDRYPRIEDTANLGLLRAAAAGQDGCVALLLDTNLVDVNFAHPKTRSTALHLACQAGCVPAVQLLLSRGAQVDAFGFQGATALMMAAGGGSLACLRLLLEAGARPGLASPEDGDMALHIAAQCGHLDIVADLIEVLPSEAVDQAGHMDSTPLARAVAAGESKVFKLLLASGASLMRTASTGDTCLHQAAQMDHSDIVEHILAQPQSFDMVNLRGFKQTTALARAAASGHSDIAERLLASGADPSLVNDVGDTSLHAAAQSGSVGVARLLVASGRLDLDAEGHRGSTALTRAAEQGHTAVVRLLAEAEASVDLADKQGDTALHLAAQEGRTETARLLLDLGADPDALGHRKTTPLSRAAESGHLEVVRMLLDAGADPAKASSAGDTPLHLAAQNGWTAVVGALLEWGGLDMDTEGNQSLSAINRAAKGGHLETVRLLRGLGAHLGPTAPSSDTPLHQAAQEGHLALLRYLLAEGADPNGPGHRGTTALGRAATRGHLLCAQALLDAGAQPDKANKAAGTQTPLHSSVQLCLSGAEEQGQALAKLLLVYGADPGLGGEKSPLETALEAGLASLVSLFIEAPRGTRSPTPGPRLRHWLGNSELD